MIEDVELKFFTYYIDLLQDVMSRNMISYCDVNYGGHAFSISDIEFRNKYTVKFCYKNSIQSKVYFEGDIKLFYSDQKYRTGELGKILVSDHYVSVRTKEKV